MSTKLVEFSFVFFSFVLAFALWAGMYFAGYYSDRPSSCPDPSKRLGAELNVSEEVQFRMSVSNIPKIFKHLRTSPPNAGTEQDYKLADWMRRKFLEFGFDQADVIPYEVLLSIPKVDKPSKIYLKEVNQASEDWRGDLNVTYYLGLDEQLSGWKLKVDVHNSQKSAAVYNTIAILHGREEPDRYVLMGNHRDGWDPSSGTAAMVEMARVFGRIKEDYGWRPRRSLVFCSWGAKQYDLLGSYEWAKKRAKVLGSRAVAYLNVDYAVKGNYSLGGKASPLLRDVLIKSSKKVLNPDPQEVKNGRVSLYDTWANSFSKSDDDTPEIPNVPVLNRKGTYSPFIHRIGIPSLDMSYKPQELDPPKINDIEDNMYYHRAMAQLWAEMALSLADSAVLPLDINWYAIYLKEVFDQFKLRYNEQISNGGTTLRHLEVAVSGFVQATENFSKEIARLDTRNIMAVRRVNDQLMYLERHFIDPRGLPSRPIYNHILFSPSMKLFGDDEDIISFPELTDLLKSVGNQSEAERPEDWAQIKSYLSGIIAHIKAASKSLVDHF